MYIYPIYTYHNKNGNIRCTPPRGAADRLPPACTHTHAHTHINILKQYICKHIHMYIYKYTS